MKPVDPKELINKYLKGECSPLEEKLLNEWYKSFDKKEEPLSALSDEEKVLLKRRMFDRIINKAGVELEMQPKVRNFRPYYYAVASIAAVLVVIFSLTFYTESHEPNTSASVASKVFSFRNTGSKLVKYVFPDGSVAWMRPSTQISYSQDFNTSATRFITMEGEAFFEVTRNPKRPFIIKSGEVFTKVLGTSFNVKCYRGDKAAEVSVVTGKVLVYKASSGKKALADEVYLLPKQKVVAPVSDEHFVKKQETGSTMLIWQKNDLSFSNTPVSEVVVALNERFKTSIEIKDKQINEYQLTADFTDVNLPSVLDLLSKSLGITYEIDNDKIRMSKLTN